jgi:endonuclease/exonuclease/phosphatase (EEP) superfamily protein YafD
MVTLSEILRDLFRVFTTVSSWLYALGLLLFVLLWQIVGERFWLAAAAGNFAPYCFMPIIPLVVLGVAARARFALLSTLPLFALGAIWFAGYYTPKNPPSPQGVQVSLVSFNAYRSNTSLEATINWLETLKSDFLLMQEVPEWQYLDLRGSLSTVYPYIAYSSTAEQDVSNILFSRYPIAETVELTGSDAAHLQQRYSVIHDELGEIALYNVDLALPVGRPRLSLFAGVVGDFIFGYDDQGRDAEIRELIERWREEPLPYIIGGDFGMTEYTGIYQDVASVASDSFRTVGRGLGGTWPVGDVEGVLPGFIPPLFRIDYIWHSSHFRATGAWLGPKLGSDHLAVLATLDYVKPT